MSALSESNLLPFIAIRRKNGCGYKTIADELKALFPPGYRGISVRSIQRFCIANNLHASSRLRDEALDVLVAFAIGMVSILVATYL